ncbi:MAG: UDP-N-acetylmuramoyl-tripeptide--D-alanyl-D-alanine ligase [Acidimicrobiales bacterium]|nr:UDP-N-acetylmuramoyl-tripeptide--D-alanyl-D-alanine ligase [Acidimicrobiales bacterium]
MRFTAAEVADTVGGTLHGADVVVVGASIDSRTLEPGQLFVPVAGVRDGHDFVAAAAAAGAAATLSARGPVDGVTTIVVDRPEAALTRLGAHARERLPERVVGITGSVGKTSTKDLCRGVLEPHLRTGVSAKSFNNELGVPLTLVNVPDDTEVAVIEMGARGRGHIASLCAVARPTIAVVTAVELVHAELMGDLDGIARCKRELPESLPADGVAVLNAAYDRVAAMAAVTSARVVRYGADDSEVRATDVELDEDLRARFRLATDWGGADVHLAVRGRHQVGNALAAAAVGLVCGIDVADVAAGLGRGELSPWRMDLRTAPGGARVLNDAYNAGPASTAAALSALVALPAERFHAVLGPMAELGDDGPAEHRRIAGLATAAGVRLVAFATDDYGIAPVDTIDAALEALGPLGPGDAVLVKGSRVAGLERLAEALLS